MKIYKKEYFRIINIVISITLLFGVLCLDDEGLAGLRMLGLMYSVMNILCTMIPSKVFFSWPCLIIRVSGFIRYILPLMSISGVREVSSLTYLVMSCEMFSHYIMIYIYPYTKSGRKNINKEQFKDRIAKNINYETNAPTFKIGVIVIILLCVVGIIVLFNRAVIMRYFMLSSTSERSMYRNGAIALMVSLFFLVTYILAIRFVESLIMPEWIKILLIVFFSIFFINGSSVTDNNISRWSLLITLFVAYNYLISYHPNKKKQLVMMMIIIAVSILTLSTMYKFNSVYSGYNTIKDTVKSSLNYNVLNAYFSGTYNVDVSLRMKDMLEQNGFFYKIQMIISDVFNNFPLLNKYLSTRESTSVYWFNYTFYGSTVSKDQIIPLVGQLYNYVGFCFILVEMFLVNKALDVSFKLQKETDLLNIYCLAYFTVTLSLVNCINLVIMLQNLWIQILPAYLIYKFNSQKVSRLVAK